MEGIKIAQNKNRLLLLLNGLIIFYLNNFHRFYTKTFRGLYKWPLLSRMAWTASP